MIAKWHRRRRGRSVQSERRQAALQPEARLSSLAKNAADNKPKAIPSRPTRAEKTVSPTRTRPAGAFSYGMDEFSPDNTCKTPFISKWISDYILQNK
jgi:hypothetical protein